MAFKTVKEKDFIKNPGYLKLDLMLKGIKVDESFFKKGEVLRKYYLARGVHGNLDLVLPKDTYASVPYQESFVKDSPYRLRRLRGKVYLTNQKKSIPVKVISPPKVYNHKINRSTKVGDLVQCHGGYVSIALGGHRYLQPHLSKNHDPRYIRKLELSVNEVIDALEEIQKERPIDVIAFSCWSGDGDDGGILQIEPYIRAIKSSFNVLLFIEIHLPKTTGWIDRTYAMGADSVCYHLGNLCSHGASHQTEKSSSMEHDISLLEYAVSIFPHGSILSHITMGNRPYNEVMEDIDCLTKIKVLPILTLVSPEELEGFEVKTEELAPVFGYVYNRANAKKIPMSWFARIAPFIAPIEGHFFSGDTPRLKLALLNFYQSRFMGGSISASLSNLRRRLRVREVRT